MSFGQGIDVNMVQMLAAVNVVAAGGRYVQPHVVATVGGKPTPLSQEPPKQVISAATAAQINEMMKSVVQHGSGSMARIKGFENDEAGKTGTSQIPVNGQYTQDVWSSYVGYMPASNPRFTMLVVVRKPHNANWIANDGYIVAAPIWRQIAQDIVLDWHIAPTPGQ
jgi:cell division protein FtsI/penicillin-binding protein 2